MAKKYVYQVVSKTKEGGIKTTNRDGYIIHIKDDMFAAISKVSDDPAKWVVTELSTGGSIVIAPTLKEAQAEALSKADALAKYLERQPIERKIFNGDLLAELKAAQAKTADLEPKAEPAPAEPAPQPEEKPKKAKATKTKAKSKAEPKPKAEPKTEAPAPAPQPEEAENKTAKRDEAIKAVLASMVETMNGIVEGLQLLVDTLREGEM